MLRNVTLLVAAAMASAYADSNLLFYNQGSGLGAVTTLNRSQPPATITNQGFSPDWTLVAHGATAYVDGLLFYNGNTGLAALARADANGNMSTDHTYNFSAGWSQIVSIKDTALFYNQQSGLGVSGQLTFETNDDFVQYPTDFHFSPGWTHIVATDQGVLLFYNAYNGSGAVGYLQDVLAANCAGQYGYCPVVDKKFVQKSSYAAGFFTTGWTSIVETHHGIMFYRSTDGLTVLADVDPNTGKVTTRSKTVQYLSPGWSSIVADASSILFYNQVTGDGAVGHIASRADFLFNSDNLGKVITDQSLLQYFSTGWTAVDNLELLTPPQFP